MSRLTKEECLKTLEEMIENGRIACVTVHCVRVFERLINEHFDNPPLTQEDIDSLCGEPIWDNTYKCWIIVSTHCDAYDEFVVYDTLYDVVVDRAFEPGRYFRKKVEA